MCQTPPHPTGVCYNKGVHKRRPMTDRELINNILSKYNNSYPNSDDWDEYVEYVNDMNRVELEYENTLIKDS